MRPIPVLLATLALGPYASVTQAQRAPWVTAELGAQYLRQTTPKYFGGNWIEASVDVAMGITIGLPLAGWLVPAAGLHTTAGRALALRSASAGVGIYPARLHGAHIHFAVARIVKTEPLGCPYRCEGPTSWADKRWGFEARIGLDIASRDRVRLGPLLWWTQSVERTQAFRPRYRAVGLGLRIGYR
jgi:hypothetical protein